MDTFTMHRGWWQILLWKNLKREVARLNCVGTMSFITVNLSDMWMHVISISVLIPEWLFLLIICLWQRGSPFEEDECIKANTSFLGWSDRQRTWAGHPELERDHYYWCLVVGAWWSRPEKNFMFSQVRQKLESRLKAKYFYCTFWFERDVDIWRSFFTGNQSSERNSGSMNRTGKDFSVTQPWIYKSMPDHIFILLPPFLSLLIVFAFQGLFVILKASLILSGSCWLYLWM